MIGCDSCVAEMCCGGRRWVWKTESDVSVWFVRLLKWKHSVPVWHHCTFQVIVTDHYVILSLDFNHCRGKTNRDVSKPSRVPPPTLCIYLPRYLAASRSRRGRWRSPGRSGGKACWCLRCSPLGRGSGRSVPHSGRAPGICTLSPGRRCTGPSCRCQPRTCGPRHQNNDIIWITSILISQLWLWLYYYVIVIISNNNKLFINYVYNKKQYKNLKSRRNIRL